MAIAGEDPAALDAILITHEHQDHIAGLSVLARRLNIPVSTDFRELVRDARLDLIIDVTGNPQVHA